MAYHDKRLVLASASPRRRELLDRFGLAYEVIPAVGEEAAPRGLPPGELVALLAANKAAEVASRCGEAVVIAADTVVEVDGRILGKPGTAERAVEMLSELSGRENRVWTGVCVREGDRILTRSECTAVHFRTLTKEEIRAYADTGEPLDKAGAYGYQGLACLFVDRIEGDYFNVVGLPVCTLGLMLRQFGVELLLPPSREESEDILI